MGIGSFVYLRRIFEGLIDEALQVANQKGNFDNDTFRNSRMAEKIEMLKDFLPAFLVENKTLYSILSLGIHELNEQDCLKHFEVVKLGIETILDEKVESYERTKRIEEARKKIQLATQQLSKK